MLSDDFGRRPTKVLRWTGSLAPSGPSQAPAIPLIRQRVLFGVVAPAVARPAHEDCPLTGKCIVADGDQVTRLRMTETQGFSGLDLFIKTQSARTRIL